MSPSHFANQWHSGVKEGQETGGRFVRCAVCLFLCQEFDSQLELLSPTQGLVTKVVSLWNPLIDELSFC